MRQGQIVRKEIAREVKERAREEAQKLKADAQADAREEIRRAAKDFEALINHPGGQRLLSYIEGRINVLNALRNSVEKGEHGTAAESLAFVSILDYVYGVIEANRQIETQEREQDDENGRP